jgi:hypothetical protein
MSYSCCDKEPQAECLKATEIDCPTVWRSHKWVTTGQPSSETFRRGSFLPLPTPVAVTSGCPWLVAAQSILCLHGHMTVFLLYWNVPLPVRTLVTGLQHGPDLDYTYKSSASKQAWGSELWLRTSRPSSRRHNSFPNRGRQQRSLGMQAGAEPQRTSRDRGAEQV